MDHSNQHTSHPYPTRARPRSGQSVLGDVEKRSLHPYSARRGRRSGFQTPRRNWSAVTLRSTTSVWLSADSVRVVRRLLGWLTGTCHASNLPKPAATPRTLAIARQRREHPNAAAMEHSTTSAVAMSMRKSSSRMNTKMPAVEMASAGVLATSGDISVLESAFRAARGGHRSGAAARWSSPRVHRWSAFLIEGGQRRRTAVPVGG